MPQVALCVACLCLQIAAIFQSSKRCAARMSEAAHDGPPNVTLFQRPVQLLEMSIPILALQFVYDTWDTLPVGVRPWTLGSLSNIEKARHRTWLEKVDTPNPDFLVKTRTIEIYPAQMNRQRLCSKCWRWASCTRWLPTDCTYISCAS